jgi:hypothetical protein
MFSSFSAWIGLILHQTGQSCFMFKSGVSDLLIPQRQVFHMVMVNGIFDGMREDMTMLYFTADNRNVVQTACALQPSFKVNTVMVKFFPSTP